MFEAMARMRIASIFALLWASLQVYDLASLHRFPPEHWLGWILGLLFVSLATALWIRARVARSLAILIGIAFAIGYVVTAYRLGLGCDESSIGCYVHLLSQPLLVLAMLAALVVPMAYNFYVRSGP
jgi:hypothetical protein